MLAHGREWGTPFNNSGILHEMWINFLESGAREEKSLIDGWGISGVSGVFAPPEGSTPAGFGVATSLSIIMNRMNDAEFCSDSFQSLNFGAGFLYILDKFAKIFVIYQSRL